MKKEMAALLLAALLGLAGCGGETARPAAGDAREETRAVQTGETKTADAAETAGAAEETKRLATQAASGEGAAPAETAAAADAARADGSAPEAGGAVRAAEEKAESRVLVVYFSWADNTIVRDEKAALASAMAHYENMGDAASQDADAVSSASILPPGNAARIAGWIAEELGGDLYAIRTAAPYPDEYNDTLDRAADEKAANARPALADALPDMSRYDTVFIGYPNWWYTAPMAVFSFIDAADLSGKRVVLFCTHGTGGLAMSVRDIRAALPKDVQLEENVLSVYRAEVPQAGGKVLAWLAEL